jgi:hypothetical protein
MAKRQWRRLSAENRRVIYRMAAAGETHDAIAAV